MSTVIHQPQDAHKFTKLRAAIARYANLFSGFAQSVVDLDQAKTDYNAKAEDYAKAKESAISGLCEAMRASGFKEEGFPSREDAAEFRNAWGASLAKPYAESTVSRLWSEITTAATTRTGQKFGVHSDESVRKAKERDAKAKETAQALKAVGVDAHTAPISIKQKAAELVVSKPALAKVLLSEAEKRESAQAKDAAKIAGMEIKAKRDYLTSLVRSADLEQLDALIATAKKLKIVVKESSK